MANYAQFITRFAYLNEPFGMELALRKFELTEEQLESIVGRYVRGKRKGLLKGKIVWTKCVKGGWVKTGPYDFDAMRACGYIAKPGHCSEFHLADSWTGESIKWNRDNFIKFEGVSNGKGCNTN